MKITILLISLLASSQILACGNTKKFHIGEYGRYLEKQLIGNATKRSGEKITINTKFVDSLLNNPNANELNKNKYELFYLISIGDIKALRAAIYVLVDVLKNPEYIIECDTKVPAFPVKELAFNIGRSEEANNELCKLSPDDWTMVIKFYNKDIQLWGYGYDLPLWEEGYKSWCG